MPLISQVSHHPGEINVDLIIRVAVHITIIVITIIIIIIIIVVVGVVVVFVVISSAEPPCHERPQAEIRLGHGRQMQLAWVAESAPGREPTRPLGPMATGLGGLVGCHREAVCGT
eukprot:4555525-Karenia_brevis.AAC.1